MHRSTLLLLRIPFSFFLMPVFWFAMSQPLQIDTGRALLVFVILHLLLYPASNAYNSWMDRDTGAIGLVAEPPPATKQLYYVSMILDGLALGLSFLISMWFAAGIVLFIAASKAYSYRRIRIKKYALPSFLLASFFQGAWVYWLVYHGAGNPAVVYFPWIPMTAAALLVGSFYPLTQIFQHRQDAEDGVRTISMAVGYTGTFVLSTVVFFLAMCTAGFYFALNLELERFLVFILFMMPVMVYFFWWWRAVAKNTSAANFRNSLRMNIIAACCTNAGFLYIFLADKV